MPTFYVFGINETTESWVMWEGSGAPGDIGKTYTDFGKIPADIIDLTSIKVSNDGSIGYLLFSLDGLIYPVSTKDFSTPVGSTINFSGQCNCVTCLDINPKDPQKLFAICLNLDQSSGVVYPINGSTVGAPISVTDVPVSLRYSQDGDTIYIFGNGDGGTITVIDNTTTPPKIISGPINIISPDISPYIENENCLDMAIGSDGSTAYLLYSNGVCLTVNLKKLNSPTQKLPSLLAPTDCRFSKIQCVNNVLYITGNVPECAVYAFDLHGAPIASGNVMIGSEKIWPMLSLSITP
jgi:DNA-binding beta-propeller fold protein YncE